jgi:cyclophilin family peptidyl-prolyl cis-trans isomerase
VLFEVNYGKILYEKSLTNQAMTPNKNTRSSVKRKSNKTLFLAIGIIAIVLIGIGAYVMLGQSSNQPNTTPTTTPTPSPAASLEPSPTTSDPSYVNPTKVLFQTSVGDITLELRSDKPITTANFINLVQEGKYDGTNFHRVIAGFMIQGGAISGSTPTINDEIGSNNRNVAYTIAMAKTSDPNSATSQFFINVADNGNLVVDQAGTKFDAVYTVFGKVVEGQNVVDAIANAPVTTNIYTHENSDPVNPVTLIKATIIS